MFLPQVLTAIITSLLGAQLARRFSSQAGATRSGWRRTSARCWCSSSATAFEGDPAAYPLLLVATGLLGAGFGLTVPVLNTYAAAFQPDRADRAVLTLNALLGLGTALAPVFVAVFVGLGFWWGLPVLSTVLLVLLLLTAARLPLRAPTWSLFRPRGTPWHPGPVLALRRVRRPLRHLRDHERQLVATLDGLARRLDHPGRGSPHCLLGHGHRVPSALRRHRPLAPAKNGLSGVAPPPGRHVRPDRRPDRRRSCGASSFSASPAWVAPPSCPWSSASAKAPFPECRPRWREA